MLEKCNESYAWQMNKLVHLSFWTIGSEAVSDCILVYSFSVPKKKEFYNSDQKNKERYMNSKKNYFRHSLLMKRSRW